MADAEFNCDPPQDFQQNGDDTVTHAMTRHAKPDIGHGVCAY